MVAAEGGIVALTRAIAMGYGPQSRVNCICPGDGDSLSMAARLEPNRLRGGDAIAVHSSRCTGVGAVSTCRFAIIADDLTGACDAGVQFSQRGFRTIVLLDASSAPRSIAEVTILNTESRNDIPDAARQKVQRACHFLIAEQVDLVYKKVDSTLRGSIAAEIEAAAQEFGHQLVLVAIGYPVMGRTVNDGWLVGDCSFPSPIHLPTLLRKQGLKEVVHVNRSILTDASDSLAKRLMSFTRSNTAGLVTITFDSISEHELKLVAQAAMEIMPRPLMVGSAGLAAAVSSALALKHGKKTICPRTAPPQARGRGHVLVVVGSTNPATVAQVKYLATARPTISIDAGSPVTLPAIQDTPLVIILTVDMPDENQRIGDTLKAILEEVPITGIVLSGGDTANLVCRILDATSIELQSEIVPGVPYGKLIGGQLHGTAIATKAGGFGKVETLKVAADFLMGLRGCADD